jgi:hypothetical protein
VELDELRVGRDAVQARLGGVEISEGDTSEPAVRRCEIHARS